VTGDDGEKKKIAHCEGQPTGQIQQNLTGEQTKQNPKTPKNQHTVNKKNTSAFHIREKKRHAYCGSTETSRWKEEWR